jgi:hypothetical protein
VVQATQEHLVFDEIGTSHITTPSGVVLSARVEGFAPPLVRPAKSRKNKRGRERKKQMMLTIHMLLWSCT